VHTLSAANTSMPAKKHQVAGEGSSAARWRRPAAKLRRRPRTKSGKEVHALSFRRPGFPAPFSSPSHQTAETAESGKAKKNGPPCVNDAVNHVGPDMDAQHSDNEHPEPVPQDPQRDHEGDQDDLPPLVLKKRWRPARLVMNSTQLERSRCTPGPLKDDSPQLEDRPVTHHCGTRDAQVQRGGFRRGQRGGPLEPVTAASAAES